MYTYFTFHVPSFHVSRITFHASLLTNFYPQSPHPKDAVNRIQNVTIPIIQISSAFIE
ncbi:hypothetical protein QUF80_00640 [Desulfococcaceae bacterium HSG8]|nr:hypothetical protein [Desulfococcaceae bacterium HSG8]